YGGYFASINRNKRSIVLDLKSEADRDAFLRLAERVDAVVENSKVGVMDRLGVGYERLRERNPRLVYAAIRGFGDPRTGPSPYAEWPAFDIVAQCMGGVVATTGAAGSTAGVPCGPSVGDLFPGSLAALGIVSAIHAARQGGQGQFLDVAMYDALVALCEAAVYNYSYDGRVLGPRGTGHPSLCPFDVFPARDGAAAIAAPTEQQWKCLCEAMGEPWLATDPRYDSNLKRVAAAAGVREIIAGWTRQHTKREIVAALAFLDLEDAVAPAEKEAARANVVRALRELDWGRTLRAVRVNGVDTRWAHDDVLTVVGGAGERLDILILPKVKAPRDVW